MNARLTALATVLDVVVLVALGVGLFFAPLTLVWAFEDGFSTELAASWGVAVNGWFLGHGVPLVLTIPPSLAQSLGIGTLDSQFQLDVALLGIALLTLLWGYRIGNRDGTKRFPLLTWVLAVGVMVGLSFLLLWSLPVQVVDIDVLDALVRPALFLAAGLALATWAGPDTAGRALMRDVVPGKLSAIVRSGFAAGVGSLAGILGLAAVAVAALVLVSFASVVSLYEALQPGVYGIIALSIAQLAFLPTVVVWAFSWMVGPGFSLGVGAMVSPLGTNLQAVPALPLAGIVPSEVPTFALMIIVVPVVVAFGAGLASRARLVGDTRGGLWQDIQTTRFADQPLVQIGVAAVIAGGVAAGGGAVLAAVTSGQMGPGRFVLVGPDPAQIALWWGLEVFIGVLLGLISGGLRRSAVSAGR